MTHLLRLMLVSISKHYTPFTLPSRWMLSSALMLSLASMSFSAFSNENRPQKQPLNMVVYAFQDNEKLQSYYDALANEINQHLPNYHLSIKLMYQSDIIQAIDNHQVDILFTNPVLFKQLRHQYAMISPIATVKKRHQNQNLSSLGGVIFQRADSQPVQHLSELMGRSVAILSKSNAGGYALPLNELHKAGVNPEKLHWIDLKTHDKVVEAVMSRTVDVGFVRTGVLEDWLANQRLALSDIRIINPQQLSAFPLLLSTELIPEWPVYALSHVPESAIKALTVALFAIDTSWPSAQKLNISGFTPPADYYALEAMLTRLRITPFDAIPNLTWMEVWQLYQVEALVAIAIFALLLGLLLWITRLYRRIKSTSSQLKQASLIFDASIEGIVITNAQRQIINVNRAFETISGYRKNEVLGLDPRFLKSGKQPESFYVDMWNALNQSGFWRGEVLNRRKNGAIYPELLTIYAIRDDNKQLQNYVAIFSDISQQKAQQAKLERLLHYDVLTGLPNRSLLNDRVKQALMSAREQQHYVAIVFIDLDGFKQVNDTYGHNAGDTLLIELGNRFITLIRSQCTIARIGGDEFIAVMTGLPSRESAYPILDQLLALCSRPFVLNDEVTVSISASIGVDFYTPKDYDLEITEMNLIKQADKAMYIAKQQGKNQIWFFDQQHRDIDRGVHTDGR